MKTFYSVALIAKITMMFTVLFDYDSSQNDERTGIQMHRRYNY